MSGGDLRPRVGLLAIGDELLNGQQLDTNSAWLAEHLEALGWRVESIRLLGDDEASIAHEIVARAGQLDLILTGGGLGPTLDDLTREAVARALGTGLELDSAVLDGLERLFEGLGRAMSPANERQARFPEGSVVLVNPHGTAPGFRVQHPLGAWIASLPGPPRELEPMFQEQLAPFLRQAFPLAPAPLVAHFYLHGKSESDFATEVGDWMARDANPRMGVCASGRVLKVRIEGRGDAAGESFAARVAQFEQRFAPWTFSRSEPNTARALGQLLLESGTSFAVAESCTGGELASRMVAQAGISAVFLEGFVTYSDAAKVARLGVDEELLEAHGAVSPEVAAAMAEGAARVAGARLAVSTTGIAGPGGASPQKPVGLVHVGLWLDGQSETHELRLPPRGRDLIREFAVTSACELARRMLALQLAGDSLPG